MSEKFKAIPKPVAPEQELQNQELRRAQAVLENSRVRYLDLFFTDDNACLELDSSTHGLTGSGS